MGKVETFVVKFDNPLAIYRPNDTLAGHTELVLSEPVKMRGVRLKITGAANVWWSEGTGDNRKSYSGKEVYLQEKLTFCQMDERNEGLLAAGSYSFPFSIVLPSDISSSFEHSTGHVRYTVETYIDEPWKIDTKTRAAFTVIRDLDLNTTGAEFMEPTSLNEEKTVGCFCCCCFCCTNGTLSIALQLRKRCFVPGETIFISGEIINKSEDAVRRTKATLKQVTVFKAANSAERAKTADKTTSSSDVCKVDQCYRIEPGRSTVWNNVPLVVPSVPPSNLEGCNIIDIKYQLEFCCSMDKCSNVLETTDILVGTIPRDGSHLFQQPVITTQPTAASDIVLQDFSCPSVLPPPPSYEDCFSGSVSLRKNKDPEEMGGDVHWAPKYPVYRQLSTTSTANS